MKRFFNNILCFLCLCCAVSNITSDATQAREKSNADESVNQADQRKSVASVFRETFENAVPTFGVTLNVESTDGRKDGLFVIGDKGKFFVKSEKDGYLYLFNGYKDKNGCEQIKKLFPCRGENNFIKAGVDLVFPRVEDGSLSFEVKEASGRERLMALVVDHKVPEFEQMTFDNEEEVAQSTAILEKCFDATYDNIEESRKINSASSEPSLGFGRRILRVHTFADEEQRDFVQRRTFYVGIGVDKFKFNGEGIRNFFNNQCCNDVIDLKQLLIEQGVVKEEDCFILTNKEATQVNVRKLFQSKLPEAAAFGANIIVDVSTHGNTVASDDKTRKRASELYLILYDSDPMDLEHTAISSNEFGDWTQALQNSRVCFIFDNCYSGLMIDERYPWDEFINQKTTAKSLGQPNICVITSSSPNQESELEDDPSCYFRGRPHSLMTNYILKTLEAKRSVSSRELNDAVSPIVTERSAKFLHGRSSDAQFMNYASSFGDDDFIINPVPEDEQDE